jgi:hypothetical protein
MSDDQLPLASVEFRGNERRWETLCYLFAASAIVTGFIKFMSTGGSHWIVGGMFITPLVFFALGRASRDFDRSIHLAFDEEGLTIPRVFTRKVPWTAVQSYSFAPDSNNGLVLSIGLIEPKLYGPQILMASNFRMSWPYARSGVRVSLDGVAGGEKEIDATFRRFAPQVRKA